MLRALAAIALVLGHAAIARAQPITFDDSGATIDITTPHYTAEFSKTNGRLLDLTDTAAGAPVTLGNFNGPWVLLYEGAQWFDASGFSPGAPLRQFSYAWDGQSLTLSYDETQAQDFDVTITVTPTTTHALLMDLVLANHATDAIELVAFPVAFAMDRFGVQRTQLPWVDGVELLDTFWSEGNGLGAGYPGPLFADFLRFDLPTTSLAMWCEHDPAARLKASTWLGLQDSGGAAFRIHKDFDLRIGIGETWTSPTLVLSVGQPLANDMAGYWTGNQLDALPTLADKLPPALLDALAGAVLWKRDFFQSVESFDAFQNRLATLPQGNLVHLVVFWPEGFDQHYPDYLPPHPTLGAQQDLADLVAAAQARGDLVMPYTNPTWWDPDAPTLSGMTIEDVALIGTDGQPRWESYGPNGGYVVCPHHPDIITRHNQTRLEFTQTIPCDLLFEDQLGARGVLIDLNPAAPDAMSFHQGLIDVAAASSAAIPIMTEGGFDRLAAHETGFCNSSRIDWKSWPTHTYRHLPMAQLWAHDLMWFTSHNLAPEIFTDTIADLTFYLAMGMSFADDLQPDVDTDWLCILDRVQKTVIKPTVGQPMDGFIHSPTGDASATIFADGTVIIANWTTAELPAVDHTIGPDGFLASKSGDLAAGYLTRLNDQPLAGPDPHLLVLTRSPGRIEVAKPLGAATSLTLIRPDSWTLDAGIRARIVNTAGAAADTPLTLTPTTISFFHADFLLGLPIDRYEIFDCETSGLCCLADLNADDATDVFDFALLASRFGTTVPPNTQGDLDGDGSVTVFDFALLAADFGCESTN